MREAPPQVWAADGSGNVEGKGKDGGDGRGKQGARVRDIYFVLAVGGSWGKLGNLREMKTFWRRQANKPEISEAKANPNSGKSQSK